jgi:putative copper export protein
MKIMLQVILLVTVCTFFGTLYYAHMKRREDRLRLARRLAELQQSIPVIGFPTSEQPLPEPIITDKVILESFEVQFTNKANFYL